MTNGVFERLVENWLTRANEREYQFPFCQALVSKGYRVMHLSTHGPQEQGKDIIAIDPKGRAVGYQLKTGDLTTTAYRAIAGEVGELVELPIKYPGVRADGKHRCVLVTNGTLTDPVREQIVDRNVSWRRKKYPELEVMPKDVLLREFLDASAPVFPVQLNSVHALLALYAHPGNGPLPCDKWSEFLIENVPLGELSRPGERLRRKEVRSRAHATTPSAAGLSGKRLGRHLSSAALLAGYALHPFVESRNHWAVFEAWVMVAGHTLAVAERYALDERWWKESFDLSFGASLTAIEGLIEEASARPHLLEGQVLVDSFVYRARMTITSGMMGAYSLIRRLQGKTHPYGDKIRACVLAHCGEMDLWGESAVPWMLMVAWYLEDCGRPLDAEGIWSVIAYALATSNKRHGPEPRILTSIPDPYLGAEEALSRRTGVPTDDTIEEASYVGHAFTLKSVIMLLARRMRRQALARVWYDVTDVAMAEMYPDPKWAWLLWRSHGGGPRETWAKRPESWKALRREAEATDTSDLPALAVARPDFLLAFLCAYPHRVRTDVVKLLDSAL